MQGGQRPLVVATGSTCIDYLAHVAAFPKPDDKARTTRLLTSPGGNSLQALVCLSRLGVPGRLITKLGSDDIGGQILATLGQERHIDTSCVELGPGNSPFSYVIVDESTHSRTILHTPAALLTPDQILPSFLDGASILLNDGRQTVAGIRLAELATEQGVPVLTDYDEDLDQADKMLGLSDYLVMSSLQLLKQSEGGEGKADLLEAMVAMLNAHPRVRFLVATMGSRGSVLMRRPHMHAPNSRDSGTHCGDDAVYDEEVGKGEVHCMSNLLAKVPQYDDVGVRWQRMWAFGKADSSSSSSSSSSSTPSSSSSDDQTNPQPDEDSELTVDLLVPTFCYRPPGTENVHVQVHYCPAYPLNPASIVDTTGAGDVFVGGVCYGLVHKLALGRLLALASLVAAHKCMGSGLDGIPQRNALPAMLLLHD